LIRQVRALARRLLLQSVLDSADSVLNFAGSSFISALDLKLGVAGGFAYSFFHSAFGPLDRSFDAIFVPWDLSPIFAAPGGQPIGGPERQDRESIEASNRPIGSESTQAALALGSTVSPANARAQHVEDPADDPPIADPVRAAPPFSQQRLDPLLLGIGADDQWRIGFSARGSAS
jgi:hypothetical protein